MEQMGKSPLLPPLSRLISPPCGRVYSSSLVLVVFAPLILRCQKDVATKQNTVPAAAVFLCVPLLLVVGDAPFQLQTSST